VKPRRGVATFMKPVQPSPELAAIVGDKAMARTEITSKLWGYIKKNDLQDKTNRRMINVDAKLGAIAAKARQKVGKQFSMFEMTKIVQKNIS
jgi:upstream activation factor subunit UAF30